MTTFKLPAPREEVGGGTPLAAALLYPAFLVPDTAVGFIPVGTFFPLPYKKAHRGGRKRQRAGIGGVLAPPRSRTWVIWKPTLE